MPIKQNHDSSWWYETAIEDVRGKQTDLAFALEISQ